jgi:hypothetical protein
LIRRPASSSIYRSYQRKWSPQLARWRYNKDGEKVTKIRFCRKLEALDKLCRHLGMYEDKLRIGGLERELEAMSDEEIERELIELERSDCHRLDASAAGSAAAAAPVLPAA